MLEQKSWCKSEVNVHIGSHTSRDTEGDYETAFAAELFKGRSGAMSMKSHTFVIKIFISLKFCILN